MVSFWQNTVVLVIVLAALAYVARALWKTMRLQKGKQAACGSCGSCAAGEAKGEPALVTIAKSSDSMRASGRN